MTDEAAPRERPVLTRLRHAAGAVLLRAANAVLPPRCPATGEIVDRPGALAPAFWQQLTFIEPPCCDRCGLPFGVDLTGADDSAVLCAACMATPFSFERARAAVVYNDASRQLILGFKYGDRLHSITTFTPWLKRAGAALIADSDVIVPVPLHRKRLWLRRFNQSALLARALAQSCAIACLPAGLLRTRHTQPQKGLSRNARYKNVSGVFAANPRHAKNIAGKRVLLIDDVFTSGATLDACARALRGAGATQVHVLTLARVTREEFI